MVVRVGFDAPGGVAQDAGEVFAELESGAEEADLDVGFGKAEQFGGLPDGETLDVPEEEDQAIFFVELCEGLVEELADFVPVDQFFGVGAPVGDVFGVGDFAGVRVGVGGLVEGYPQTLAIA
jgi:hypothetical protein